MLSAEQEELVKMIATEENLGTTLNFDSNIGKIGKEWFCRRLANAEASSNPGISLTVLEQKIWDQIQRAVTLIELWQGMEGNLAPSELYPAATAQSRKEFRVEKLYEIVVGVLAIQPELATEGQESVLRQIVAQRLRITERVWFDIKIEEESPLCRFRLPLLDEIHQLNTSAAPYWILTEGAWILSQLGKDDPHEAILRLFVPSSLDNCNRVYCQHVASAILADSLIPLDGIDGFDLSNKAQTPGYIGLDNPFNDFVADRFTHDLSSSGRFRQLDIPLDDLQVGDHVWAQNIQDYDLLRPGGIWAGEHSIVLSRFSDRPRTAVGTWEETTGGAIMIAGLEVQLTVGEIRTKLLNDLNRGLLRTRDRVKEHIAENAGTNGPSGITEIPLSDPRPDHPHETILRIYRDVNVEQGLDQTLLKTVWYLEQTVEMFPFSVGLGFQSDLEQGVLSEDFRREFENHKASLSHNDLITVVTEIENSQWRITDKGKNRTYTVIKSGGELNIYVRHYLWSRNETPVTFNMWLEDYVTPPPVLPNDFTIDEVWGLRHPLLGPGDSVRVTRPKAER